MDAGNGTSLQLTGSMTVSAWIYSAAFPADDAAIVSKRASTELGFQLDTTVDRGPRTIGFKLTKSTGGLMARYGATTLALNQWYHVAGVYDAATQTMHVYLNGVLDDGDLLGTVTSSQQNSALPVAIGKRSGASGYAFNGRIDEVRIYERALSQAEVQTDMNTPVGVQPVLIDDVAPAFTTVGSWGVDGGGYGGLNHYHAAGTGSNQANWTTNLRPGQYRVSVTWLAAGNRATDAPFTVFDGSTPLATVRVNQQQTPADFTEGGLGWKDLGTFTITGNTLVVQLSNAANGYVIADAIRIQKVG